jgi:hypothetical protein
MLFLLAPVASIAPLIGSFHEADGCCLLSVVCSFAAAKARLCSPPCATVDRRVAFQFFFHQVDVGALGSNEGTVVLQHLDE